MEKHVKQATKKTQKIKDMIQAGKTNAEIVKAIPEATLRQIYNLRYHIKKNAKKKSAKKMVEDYRTKHPKIVAVWNADAHSSGHQFDIPVVQQVATVTPNETQVGGEHYKTNNIQPWDAIHAWGLGFFSGNVVKYVARHREKNGVEDLKKARHYLDKLIELMEVKQ